MLAALSAGRAARAQLTIRVTGVPAVTGPNAVIHVAGTFNGWNPAAPDAVLAARPDGGYALTLPDSVRGAVAFKFTLGSWKAVEVAAGGGDVANRTILVPATGAITYTATIAAWRDSTASVAPKPSTASPSVSTLGDSVLIPQLGRTRRVWLYLPPGYARSAARYPVLYLQDGQNVFDAATSFAGEWGVDESLDSLRALGDPGAIVVAVDNGGSHRLDEYDPWKSADPRYGGGEGDAYVDFLARTLKPYVDAHYRTRPDREHTGVLGSSMGGLISLYAALKYPEVFGRAGVFSCACWIARPQLLAYARRVRPLHPPARFYFVSGTHETADDEPARDQQAVVDALAAAGFPTGVAVVSVVRADGQHAEWFWRREFPAAYAWLFGGGPAADPLRAPAFPRRSGSR
ncbi:phosphonate ABC transporter ATP-binding protein [Gemmatimonadetes bacterium T265]|nr:phosphonate ABC transporter ATP-binding protein [Gemmatimonadetes bacterium T265]